MRLRRSLYVDSLHMDYRRSAHRPTPIVGHDARFARLRPTHSAFDFDSDKIRWRYELAHGGIEQPIARIFLAECAGPIR